MVTSKQESSGKGWNLLPGFRGGGGVNANKHRGQERQPQLQQQYGNSAVSTVAARMSGDIATQHCTAVITVSNRQ
jgi:hypothetical protein